MLVVSSRVVSLLAMESVCLLQCVHCPQPLHAAARCSVITAEYFNNKIFSPGHIGGNPPPDTRSA